LYSPQQFEKRQNREKHSNHSKKTCFGSRCHFFLSDNRLLSVTIVRTSKTSKSLK
jgi:hypothetical protein